MINTIKSLIYKSNLEVLKGVIWINRNINYTPENEVNPPSTSKMLPVTKLDASLKR